MIMNDNFVNKKVFFYRKPNQVYISVENELKEERNQ